MAAVSDVAGEDADIGEEPDPRDPASPWGAARVQRFVWQEGPGVSQGPVPGAAGVQAGRSCSAAKSGSATLGQRSWNAGGVSEAAGAGASAGGAGDADDPQDRDKQRGRGALAQFAGSVVGAGVYDPGGDRSIRAI